MNDVVLNRLPARELAHLVRAKRVSPIEIVNAHLAAIERVNPQVNAIVTLVAEQALAIARSAESAVTRGEALGALHGVPIGIKDTTPTAGIRTTWGSPLLADHVPQEDAEIVARLKRAGAIVIGKTNTPEFAAGANTVNRVFGATGNPWAPRLTAGGSTGGGAAALAAAMIPLAEGTDFGGSLRVPAALCGVVGLRTTAGLVPKFPAQLPWHDMSVAGPMARDAEDCALLLDAMIGLSAKSPLSCAPPWESAQAVVRATEDLRGLRVAYVADIAGIGVDTEIEGICRGAAFALAAHGASVEEATLDLADGRDSFMVLRGAAMVGNHLERLDKLDQLGANLAGNIKFGMDLQALDLARAEHKRAEIWHRFRTFFERYDLMLTACSPVLPFPVENNYPTEINGRRLENYVDWIGPTFLVSLAALPGVSVPAGLTRSRLPVGLQIVGPRYSEPRILACAKMVERDHPVGWAPLAA